MIIFDKAFNGASLGIDNELEDGKLYIDIFNSENRTKASLKLNMQHIILLHDHLDTIIKKYNESKTICISAP